MRARMRVAKQIGVFVALLSFLAVFAAPVPVYADIVKCGRGPDISSACTLCDIVKGVADLITFIRNIMVFIALAVITAMGIMYIVSAGNSGMMETAKKGIWAALAGITIVLLAWVVVNTVAYTVLGAKNDLGVGASFSIAGGFTFNCEEGL